MTVWSLIDLQEQLENVNTQVQQYQQYQQYNGLVIHVLDPIIFYSQRSYLYILSTAARELVEGSLEDEEPVQIDEHEVVDGGAEETDHQAGHNLAEVPAEVPP